MTLLYEPSIDFSKWFYKDDITHVFFYQKETVSFIANAFKSYTVNKRLIIFES